MDELNDFFDLTKDFVRDELPRGCISGNLHAVRSVQTNSKVVKREYVGKEYAESVSKFEESQLDEVDMSEPVGISEMDTLDEEFSEEESYNTNDAAGGGIDIKNKFDDKFYDKYRFDFNRNPSLPIFQVRSNIVDLIEKNPVVILQGDTGCGKTTQVPQYILDEACKRRQYCHIVCTQPRRIAAISIAKRVCEERCWPSNAVCSYQVGLHSNINEDTRLLYCTTGVLLQRLIREKTLNHFTHILLDEVHERDQEMDFLLIVIRRLLMTNSRNVKIILMSATINADEFANYFAIRRQPAPIFHVDLRPVYNVQTYYTTDLGRLNVHKIEVDYDQPKISDEMYLAALKVLMVIENIEKCEMEQEEKASKKNKSSVLIFLPGIYEIDVFNGKMISIINRNTPSTEMDSDRLNMYPIRLHSMISPDEQMRAFQQPPPGYRKVLLATNIAESSITVPDVKYVIDFCLTKLLVNDSSTNLSTLQMYWASRANCIQRAGRAGRVMNGRVYRMVPRHFYETQMDEYTQPEMERCPLQNVVLKAKLLDMGPPPDILGLAMNPPSLSDVRNTVLSLKEVGALYTHVDGVYSLVDGDLSYWGRIMDALPIDIHLTRLIIIGYMFSCFEEAIVIAAGLSVRSLFLPFDDNFNTNHDSFLQKLVWADGSGSDLIAIWRAYNVYMSMCSHQTTYVCNSDWARRYQINIRSLHEMELLVDELKRRLSNLNMKPSYNSTRVVWKDSEKPIILKIVFAGAFYPNYFIRDNNKVAGRERSIHHILAGREPCNTVYFTNFQARIMGELYTRPIKDLFREMRIPPKNIDITFEPGTEKVFATFKSSSNEDEDDVKYKLYAPGRINPDVLKSVRMRVEKLRRGIRIMDPRLAMRYVQENNIGVVVDGIWHPTRKSTLHSEITCYPSLFDKKVRGYISHIVSCSKFYFQPLTEKQTLKEIEAILNEPRNLRENKFIHASSIDKGMILSALRGRLYQRGIVVKIIVARRSAPKFLVRFIDYGNSAILPLENLRSLSKCGESIKDYPPRLYECRLAAVQPATMSSLRNLWSDMANKVLHDISQAGVIEIEVYSFVSKVASVIIHLSDGNLNEKLIELHHARKSDEDYTSKLDHDFRTRKHRFRQTLTFAEQTQQNEAYIREKEPLADFDLEPPPAQRCTKSIQLRGPYSPLEAQMYSILRVGTWKSVSIERNSVNAILLDTDPQDFHDSMVVAAVVTENQHCDRMTARNTTTMPNIHGFPALMVMMFCPRMQMKYNHTRTKYISILAGLGYDENTMQSLFEEHDLILPLDVDILMDDVAQINKIRYLMDTMFHTKTDEEYPSVTPSDRSIIAGNIKTALLNLLNKNRDFIEQHTTAEDSIKWSKEPLDETVDEIDNIFGNRTQFWMHNVMPLNEEKFNIISALTKNCAQLYESRNHENSLPTVCKLCNLNLENISDIRIHLLSRMHMDRERQISFTPPPQL